MRVVYVKAPFQFEIREMPIPEPGENQVLLEVKACAVCGTDMHTAADDAADFESFGHEITGVVVKNGPGANRFAPGTAVAVESGTFMADMQVALVNDGPFTILLNSKKEF